MTDSAHIVVLDETNFVEVVVEGSAHRPVLVDFWADWCGPCKTLMPILEKLAIEYDGAFTLAKLDTEAHPGIAQQLGIRSLPTVKLFKDKQLVDEFMGALPESDVRKFLDAHVEALAPAEPAGDNRVEAAMALFEQGNVDQAIEILKAVQAEDPTNTEALLSLGQISISTGEFETAASCLDVLSEEARNSTAGRRLAAMLKLAKQESSEPVDVNALKQALQADDTNSDARFKLAMHTALSGDVQGALDQLLVLLQKDRGYNDGAAQKNMLALFDVLGDDPLAGQYRRKMFGMLN